MRSCRRHCTEWCSAVVAVRCRRRHRFYRLIAVSPYSWLDTDSGQPSVNNKPVVCWCTNLSTATIVYTLAMAGDHDIVHSSNATTPHPPTSSTAAAAAAVTILLAAVCTFHFVSVCVVVYAGDIILLAPSVAALQRLVSLCEVNLQSLELAISISRSHSVGLYQNRPAFQHFDIALTL